MPVLNAEVEEVVSSMVPELHHCLDVRLSILALIGKIHVHKHLYGR